VEDRAGVRDLVERRLERLIRIGVSAKEKSALVLGLFMLFPAAIGCGGGDTVEQKLSDRAGHPISGCEESGTVHGWTFYTCDDGNVTGAIDANGDPHVISESVFPGDGQP
jgi:hypothetical protein